MDLLKLQLFLNTLYLYTSIFHFYFVSAFKLRSVQYFPWWSILFNCALIFVMFFCCTCNFKFNSITLYLLSRLLYSHPWNCELTPTEKIMKLIKCQKTDLTKTFDALSLHRIIYLSISLYFLINLLISNLSNIYLIRLSIHLSI